MTNDPQASEHHSIALPPEVLASLPTIDKNKIDFSCGVNNLLNRTLRFVLPIGSLGGEAERLVYPPHSPKSGQPIKTVLLGIPDKGIVFENPADHAYQAVRGNGAEAILINSVTMSEARSLLDFVESFRVPPMDLSVAQVRQVLAFARERLGIADFYDKKIVSVDKEMSVIDPTLVIEGSSSPGTAVCGLMQCSKPDLHKAVHVLGPSKYYDGPEPQVYPHEEGAIFVTSGRHTWGVDVKAFLQGFVRLENGNERMLHGLLEFAGAEITAKSIAVD